MGTESNIHEIVKLFPKWSVEEADALWCAAFVLYCCKKAGMCIPYKPKECSLSLAACPAWEEWAKADHRITHVPENDEPQCGDIVIFDHVFCDSPHDHMGIVIKVKKIFLWLLKAILTTYHVLLNEKEIHIFAVTSEYRLISSIKTVAPNDNHS